MPLVLLEVVVVVVVVVAVVVVELGSWTVDMTALHLSGGCGRLLEGISFYSLLTYLLHSFLTSLLYTLLSYLLHSL